MNENNQNSNNVANDGGNSAIRQSGKSYLRHVLGFFAVLLLVGGGYWVWNGYFSEGARYRRQVEENMKLYNAWEQKYTKAMTEDVYGGKTPEETLNMFVDALKKDDIDLASKYFLLNDVGDIDQKWVDGLKKTKDAGGFGFVIEMIPGMEFDKTHSSFDTAWFVIKNSEGMVDYSIILTLNEFSKIWKIESL